MRTSIRMAVAVVAALVISVATAPVSLARPVWDTTAVRITHDVSPTPKVIDLRVGEHRHFDRVVIDLDGPVPGYTVRYVRSLTYDGSGDAVPLRGRKFVSVGLFPAKAHNARGQNVYRGPQLKQYQLSALRGGAFTGDFEGQVSFGLAVRSRSELRVFELHAPNRIVIDVRH